MPHSHDKVSVRVHQSIEFLFADFDLATEWTRGFNNARRRDFETYRAERVDPFLRGVRAYWLTLMHLRRHGERHIDLNAVLHDTRSVT